MNSPKRKICPKRRICIVTGSRAEYGLLYWLMKELDGMPEVDFRLAVTGMHLSETFGSTWKVIEKDGFNIDAKIDVLSKKDSRLGMAEAVAKGCSGFAEYFESSKPDIVVVLGDRFEILAAVQAAFIIGVPVAHIHGGEVTEGAVDDAFRHCITKMSHLHFASMEEYRKRIIQLGENPDRVFTVGAAGLDSLRLFETPSKEELEKELSFKFKETNFLVTYHPVTIGDWKPEIAMNSLFEALDRYKDSGVVITYPNADTMGVELLGMIEKYAEENKDRVLAVSSLGQRRYLGMLKNVDAVIGNSSSGIIEAPTAKIPTVNIGKRQEGRIQAASVINCTEDADVIKEAIDKALEMKEECKNIENPYGDGKTSGRIAKILTQTDLSGIFIKKFYDI